MNPIKFEIKELNNTLNFTILLAIYISNIGKNMEYFRSVF